MAKAVLVLEADYDRLLAEAERLRAELRDAHRMFSFILVKVGPVTLLPCDMMDKWTIYRTEHPAQQAVTFEARAALESEQ